MRLGAARMLQEASRLIAPPAGLAPSFPSLFPCAAACPIQKFASMTSARRGRLWTFSPTAFIWSGAWRAACSHTHDILLMSRNYSHLQLGEGEHLLRGIGGGANCCQQVHGEECRQGFFSPPRARAPLPCAAHQQDAFLCWRRQAANRSASVCQVAQLPLRVHCTCRQLIEHFHHFHHVLLWWVR